MWPSPPFFLARGSGLLLLLTPKRRDNRLNPGHFKSDNLPAQRYPRIKRLERIGIQGLIEAFNKGALWIGWVNGGGAQLYGSHTWVKIRHR